MKTIRRFFVWGSKTFLILIVVNIVIIFSMNPMGDVERLNNLGVVTLLLVCSLTIWISWQIEYRNGHYKFGKWLGDKLRNILAVKVSKNLREFTDKMIMSRTFSESEIVQFQRLLEVEKMPEEKRGKFLLQEINRLFNYFSSDRKIDDNEWEIFVKSRKAFSCMIPEVSKSGISQRSIGEYRARGIISEGRLLETSSEKFPLKKNQGERIFLIMPALFTKRKKVVEKISYSGITRSVNLGVGFRYRVGTIKPRLLKKEIVSIEDRGVFFITSERVGFHGDKKSWMTPINKINDVQVEEDVGLEIFKSGRENPILIYPGDIDTAAALLNMVMNGQYQIDQSQIAI